MSCRAGSVAGSTFSSATPLRDQFGLNDMSDSFSVADTASVFSRADKEREKANRARLSAQLKVIFNPQFLLMEGVGFLPLSKIYEKGQF